MPLNALRVALQGLNFPLSPIAAAVQGLIAEIEQGIWPPRPQDSAGSWAKKGKRRGPTRTQLLDDDDAILSAIVSAVTCGALST